jgi:SAM-dependent methyltransferase
VTDVDWPAYLAAFHAERAGITEDVLEHALDTAGSTAYDWAAEPLAAETVLDLACGSAPMAARVSGARYMGLDLSPAELAAAAARGVPVARADVTRLPVPDGSVDAVVMSMALMLVPLPQTLNEVRRVLRPDGMFVATMPHNRPMPRADWLRYARLCLALGHPGLTYPNDRELADPAAAFVAAGLHLQHDESRPFVYDIADSVLADQLLASLYLPDVPPERMRAGQRAVHGWVGSTVTTPIRRLIATRLARPDALSRPQPVPGADKQRYLDRAT